MASLLKKYPILTKAQSPFKQLSDIEKMVKKQRSRYSEFHPNPDADKSHIKYFTRHSAKTNVPINVGSLEEMYDEMRTKRNMVCGQMRTTFDYWHLGRIFSAAPSLNSDFVTCNPNKRIFAAPSEPGFIVQFANLIKAWRPMPIQSDPGLIDHN